MAMTKPPFLNGRSSPVRLRVPSGKIRNELPARTDADACSIAASDCSRLRVLYKAELRKLPILVRAWDLAGFVPLERGNREQSLPAIDRAAEALMEGNSFLIFPEGTRSRAGNLLPFKKGGFIMAIKGQAPVVPVAIVGAREAMRKGSFVIQPVTVTVRLGTPVETAGLTLADRDLLASNVRLAIEQLLLPKG